VSFSRLILIALILWLGWMGPLPLFAETLNSPLQPISGPPIAALADWEQQRSVLQNQFQAEIYGWLPQQPRVTGHFLHSAQLSGFPARFEEHVVLFWWGKSLLRRIHLLILAPIQATPSKAAVMFLNKCGNHTLLKTSELPRYLPLYQNLCPAEMRERGWQSDYWSIAQPLLAGLTLISLHESEIAPDDPVNFAESLSALPEQIFKPGSRPGLIAAWAWGLRGVRDYLETLPEFQDKKIGLFGHSRRGKAALLATALDPRFDFVIPHQTGTLGAAALRLHPAESLASITTFFPHWFTPALAQRWPESLSIDQHELLALVAPRPLLIDEGQKDFWASPALSLATLNAALPVYRLYGFNFAQGLQSWLPEQPSQTLFEQRVAHVLTADAHTMNRGYWQAIVAFLRAQKIL
jgi:hypothetical protein